MERLVMAADDPAALAPHWQRAQHALRQPLNAVGLFAQALRQQGVGPAQESALRGLLEAVGAMEHELDRFFQGLASGLQAPEPAAPLTVREPPAPWTALPAAEARSGLAKAAAQTGAAPSTGPADQRPGGSPARSTGVSSAAGGLGATRCLLIDDDAAARLGLSMLLEAWGLQVQTFGALAPVLAWAGSQEAEEAPAPSLVIADYHLPRPGDGLAAIRALRAAWPRRPLPALLLTGDSAVAGLDGELEVMFKPVPPERLRQAVERIVRPTAPRPPLQVGA